MKFEMAAFRRSREKKRSRASVKPSDGEVPVLELRFIECVEAAVRGVADAPSQWSLFEDDVRRCLVHVFPYAVLYTIEGDHILIVAIMHCSSREPGYWRLRVEEGR